MKEINELNGRLVGAMKETMPEYGYAVTREWSASEFEGVPEGLQQEIRGLAKRLGKAIPDDFGFTLSLGEGGTALSLEYENGLATGGFRGQEWNPDQSIFEQLEACDWNEQRGWFVQGSEMFDHIAEMAKELPVMMPSTKRLQKEFREETKAYIKEKRADLSCAHVLLWDGDESLYDEEFESLTAFQEQLHDLMPHMVHVVTVVADGKPIPAETIDGFKRAALKELEEMPISHAKASGKFQFIMSEMERLREESEEAA